MPEDETSKLSKTEEKQSFIKQLDERIKTLDDKNKEYERLVERNEELSARHLLGGKTDAGQSNVTVKEETAVEYADRISKGLMKPGER